MVKRSSIRSLGTRLIDISRPMQYHANSSYAVDLSTVSSPWAYDTYRTYTTEPNLYTLSGSLCSKS